MGGYTSSTSFGALDDDDFTHAGTAYTVTAINWNRTTASGVVSNTLALVTGAELPDGTVLTLNGTALTVGADSETTTVGRESWNLRTLGIDFDWVTDTKVTTSLSFSNNPATGAPGITGTPLVGETLTATIGDMADTDLLPTTTFPDGYSFQWVLVDGVTETDIASATSQTYVPVAADAGKTLKVKVTFTDGGGTSETLASEATAAVPAEPEGCSARTHANWCAKLTVGVGDEHGTTIYGWRAGTDVGALDDDTIDYGGLPGWSLEDLYHVSNSMTLDFVNRLLPRGTVFNLGGTEFIADSQSETFSDGYFWATFKGNFPADFVPWVDGQKVTVSANLPPVLVSAAADGAELVLTYAEDLDTGSVPAADAYSVSVDSGTETNPSSVGISGTKVTLTLASAVTSSSQTVTVSYAVPASNPVQDASGLKAAGFGSSDHTVTNRTGVTNNAPTVENEIPDQSAQAGTAFSYGFPADTFDDADAGDTLSYTAKKDDDTTLPTWLSFNATTRTFMGTPADTDVGTVSVKVTASDDSGATNATVSDTFDIEVIAAPEACSVRTDANWCTTLTVGFTISGNNTFYGYKNVAYGGLDDVNIEHGVTTWGVTHIQYAGTAISVKLDEHILRGTVFNFGGSLFTADSSSEQSLIGSYGWTLPSDFAWFVGQKVTVSANLPPALDSATVDGASLVLTYAENLDTNSVPAASAYSVSVDSGTAAAPSSVGITGKKVTLTLASAVTSSSQTVTVTYTVPASNPVQDPSELKAAGFGSTDHMVTNNTGATNTAPTVENEIPDQATTVGTAFSYAFPADTFDDADPTDTLTYTAAQSDDSVLPTWLTFTSGTRTFSGTPADTDVGTVSVKVTADDGSGTTNATVSDTFDIEVVAVSEACSVREASGANWCTTLTVAESPGGSGTAYGFAHNSYGGLGEGTIDHGRTWEVRGLWIWDANTGTDGVIVDFQTGRVPHGTVFDFGGESFTANAASEHSDTTRYRWVLPAGLAWIAGQKVTVSANLPPEVTGVTVNGDKLVLTYAEDLDTNSVPAVGAYLVSVDSGTAVAPSSVGIAADKVTLTLASVVTSGQAVTVSYTVPVSNPVQDEFGLAAAAFGSSDHTVTYIEECKGVICLTDGDGNAIDPMDGDAEGRLEVKYRGEFGTVCDDRFDRAFDDPGTPGVTTKVPNQAAHLACRWIGFETGTMVSNAGKPVAPQSKPIWLDDVRCVSATDKHWRPAGSPDPTRLHHCYNAGVGLHNCGTKAKPDHTEDVWLSCTGTSESAMQEEEAGLTAVFEDVPGSHDGATPFTFRIVLSEAIANDADDVRDNVVKVTGGSVDSATSVNGQTDEWQITVDPDGAGDITLTVEAGGTCGDPGVLCTAGGEGLSETVTGTVEGPAGVQPLTAQFENGPGTHDGTGPFNVFLRFSEAPANVKNIHIKGALTITGGRILRVRVVGGAVNGDEAHRRVEIEPAGDGDVRLSLFPTTDCAATNALCTADGRKLESLIGLSIPGPASAPPPPAPITATFENVPEEHRGKTRLDLHVRFSEPPTGGRNAVAASLTMTRAAKWGVKPLDDTNKLYRSALQPHDFRPITVTLNPTANCAATGALCTAAGGKLETGISVTIPGPVAIRVADATVEEAAGAVLAFAVTLDRVRHDTVTVDYATENGTATAGEDYTAASGTLTFAAGETAKTVEVAVLDDAHDEGNETLVLRLSNPSGARIADGEATGTIENTDLMPQAWLARFGRTVAEQVIDAVETRMGAPRTPGAEVSLAGRRIGLGPLFGADAAPDDGDAALAKRARETEAEAEEGQRRLAAWLRGAAEEEERPGLVTQTVTERALLLGSSFSLTAAPGDGAPGAVSLWGRAAVSRFDGREDGLTLDGEVASGLLGADWARERSTLGLILSHSRGEGGYRGEGGSGTVSSTLTGLYPWGRHALNDRVTVWGVAGYGAGTLTLTPENDDGTPRAAIRTDMDLMMGAVGLRGVVVEAPADGGPELSLKTDALAVRTSSEAVRGSADAGGNLAAAQGDVTRLRLGLEGTWRGLALGTGTLSPRLEVGVRHDGGDAETGFGLDLGGGLAWSDPGTGIRAEVSGRGLLTHESAGFRQRGIAGSFGWDPAPGSNRGPSLSLTQTMGLSATGGADALLGRTTLEGLAANDDGDEFDRRRLELRLGYGFGAFGDGFTWKPEAGFGMSEGQRDYSLGWRLVRDRRRGDLGSLELLFEARRQESANDDTPPEHTIGFRLTSRF